MQTQWNRIQMFLVFNSIALPIAFGITPNMVVTNTVKMYVSIMAFCLHVVLINGTLRADRWIKYIDEKLKLLEIIEENELNAIRVKIFSDEKFWLMRKSKFASRRLFGAVGLAVMILWLVLSMRYFYRT